MVECTNFPLDEEDCKSCKEYPCDIVRMSYAMNDIGKRAQELDSKEIIHRIRIGNKTILRIIIAFIILIISLGIMDKVM